MISLNDEQRKAVLSHPGEPLRLVDPATHQTFVLVPAEEFERLNQGAYDSTPWTEEEMDALASEDADALGWDGMDAYQEPKP